MKLTRRQFTLTLASTLASTKLVAAGEWSQWRGPRRNGVVASDFAWPDSLAETRLTQIWKSELQPSYSGPIVAEEQVFVTETIDRQFEAVTSFSLSDGEQRWRKQWTGAMSVPFFARSNGSWIRSTPAWERGKLLVGGMRDQLVCLDTNDGAELVAERSDCESGIQAADLWLRLLTAYRGWLRVHAGGRRLPQDRHEYGPSGVARLGRWRGYVRERVLFARSVDH